jgi:hypothetical protein
MEMTHAMDEISYKLQGLDMGYGIYDTYTWLYDIRFGLWYVLYMAHGINFKRAQICFNKRWLVCLSLHGIRFLVGFYGILVTRYKELIDSDND